jgi:aminoglycoside 2''-phosphotransferase
VDSDSETDAMLTCASPRTGTFLFKASRSHKRDVRKESIGIVKRERIEQEPWISWPDLSRELNMSGQDSATIVGLGQNNIAYDLGGVIVRVPRQPAAERELERETLVLTTLRQLLPTPVPALALRNIGERFVSVHPKLRGDPLSDITGLSEQERRVLAGDIGGFLKALHSIPVSQWPLRPIAHPSSEWREFLGRCEAQVFPIIQACRAVDLRERIGDFIAMCAPLPLSIIHGDFGTGNILIDQGRLSGVIDFSGCGPGDPAYDLASLAAGFGDDFAELVMSSLPKNKGMLERIEFYKSTFPLLDIMHGIETQDEEALQAGLLSVAGEECL